MKTHRITLVASLVVMNLAVATGVHLLWARGGEVNAALKQTTSSSTSEDQLIAMIARTSPAVVSILVQQEIEMESLLNIGSNDNITKGEDQNHIVDIARGTGFLVSKEGMIITNRHVASDRSAIFSVFLTDDRSFKAEVLDIDPINDLAILKINPEKPEDVFPALELETNDDLRIGSSVVVIGNALGKYSNTVTSGILSGINRTLEAVNEATGEYEYLEDVLQTDAAINSGNSGGPLVNLSGRVIGVSTAIESGAQSLGFAIPVSEVRKILVSYERYASIARPRLGVRVITLTPETSISEKVDHKQGALVRAYDGQHAVVPNSPASRAGIHEGDIILQVNKIDVQGDRTLSKIIQDMSVGDQVVLTIARGADTITLIASLDAHPPYGR